MTKCFYCQKKIKIVEYSCKCTTKKFCNKCAMPENHKCTFDFVKENKEKLGVKLVKVDNQKMIKI